jgi:hypothetical protein
LNIPVVPQMAKLGANRPLPADSPKPPSLLTQKLAEDRAMAGIGHDHNRYRGRVRVLLSTYRASQRLALEGVISAGDLLRHREDALRKLTELAVTSEDADDCTQYCNEAITEVSTS